MDKQSDCFEISAEGAFKLISMLSDEELDKLSDMLTADNDENYFSIADLVDLIEPIKKIDVNDIKLIAMDYSYPDVIDEFLRVFYSVPIKDTDYVSNMKFKGWNDLTVMEADIPKMDAFDVGTCLTAIVRKENFCSGALKGALENGILVKLLERLKELMDKQE